MSGPAAATSELVVHLEWPLPPSVPAGTATAVFCLGTCFHRREAVEDLVIVVDDVRHRPAAFGMPRPDVFESLHQGSADGDPVGNSFRSGFWATVPIDAGDHPGTLELGVAVSLEGGGQLSASLGRIEVVEREPAPRSETLPARSGPGLIAICMATFEPEMSLFRRQIDSLRSQTDDGWVCLISDDCSSPDRFEQITQVVGADPRFALSRSPARLGFYRNFERALRMVPPEAELVALCDQDDRWHDEKLEVLRGALGSATLAYSDQRLVDAEGRVLRETLWKGRRNNSSNLASVLIANTITGAATLFHREVAELALPFPDTPGFQFHDHWLAIVAMAMGEVAYVDRPLYDYVQHAGAVFGDVTQGGGSSTTRSTRPRRRPSLEGWRGFFGRWRGAYFYGYLAREVQAQAVLVRCSARLTPPKRRVLRRFVASARSPVAFAWLAARPVRGLVGFTETLGSETDLVRGILWRWLMALRARVPSSRRRWAGDAGLPPPGSFNQKRLRRWRASV